MAEPQALPTSKPTPQLQIGQTYIKGRISYARTTKTEQGRLFLTLLKIPAVDQYSHPSTVELSGQTKLGEVGDDWQGICAVTGYPRTFDSKPDPETGEVKTVRTATINLRVVE